MPTLPTYTGNPSLAERFESLKRDGKSPTDAVELLSELYYAFHFRIVQPLPGDPCFRLRIDGELVVELDGRRLDPERILTREPGLLDPVPIPLDRYRWMCADPRQAERDALAELTIEAPNNNIETQVKPPEPEVAPDSDADPQPGPQPESNLVPEAEPVRDLGGREPEHAWGDAADYVEGIIKKEKRPLPRKKDGSPNIARGVALMMEYFKDEPEPPKERSVRRWIKRKDNWPRTSKWWDDNIVAHLLRQ